ncbi:hypothetical protein MASR1M107_19230 [Ignavibacteriales bacterium]
MQKYILVVEDSPTQLEQLAYILESEGYPVKTAANGKIAVSQIEVEKPALVITDILMPEMDGYDLCKHVKNNNATKDIPVMLLTNLSDPHDVIKGLQSGADNFLTKPYNKEFLLSRVKYILVNQEIRISSPVSNMGMEIVFGGKKYFINSDRIQIVDLLLSTYENAIQKNGELAEANQQLLRMHRELAKKNHELEKLNKDKNKFLSMAAHDLRNPVGAILSFGLILQDDMKKKFAEEELEFVKIIIKSSDFVLQLLNELLDISVIESGELNLKKADLEFANLVQNNIALNKVLADKKNIELRYESNVEEIELNLDPVKIEQVLNNLTSNAIKFSFPGNAVTLFIKKMNNELAFGVKDNGQGIPATEINKLFIPFEKLSVRSTAGEKSTGLGLVIVKKIMEAHGGRVEVTSKQGEGSVFTCTIPL